MAVIRHLLQRWGFVKLGRYGLVLTAEDRILSMRPQVLDDGAGGRIVGWRDDDLAMVELAPWEPELDRSRAARAPRAELPGMPPTPPPRARMLPPAQPVITQPSSSAQVAAPGASGAVMAVAVAPGAMVDEDDWEWTIALARARAAAEQTQATPVQAPAVQAPRPPTHSAPAIASVPVDTTAPTAPTTVIPVPLLPTIHGAGRAARFDPPNRFPKGTAPIGPDTEQTASVVGDETEPCLTVGDRTMPGIGMPLVAHAVALPSTKRRTVRRG